MFYVVLCLISFISCLSFDDICDLMSCVFLVVCFLGLGGIFNTGREHLHVARGTVPIIHLDWDTNDTTSKGGVAFKPMQHVNIDVNNTYTDNTNQQGSTQAHEHGIVEKERDEDSEGGDKEQDVQNELEVNNEKESKDIVDTPHDDADDNNNDDYTDNQVDNKDDTKKDDNDYTGDSSDNDRNEGDNNESDDDNNNDINDELDKEQKAFDSQPNIPSSIDYGTDDDSGDHYHIDN